MTPRRPLPYRSRQRVVEEFYRHHQMLFGPDERPSLKWLMITTEIDSKTTLHRCRANYETKLRRLGIEVATVENDRSGEPLDLFL